MFSRRPCPVVLLLRRRSFLLIGLDWIGLEIYLIIDTYNTDLAHFSRITTIISSLIHSFFLSILSFFSLHLLDFVFYILFIGCILLLGFVDYNHFLFVFFLVHHHFVLRLYTPHSEFLQTKEKERGIMYCILNSAGGDL